VINHFPNGRAYLIPRHNEEINSKEHLWNCYLQFKNLILSKKFDDDLVFLWKEDFNELYENYHPKLGLK
jgi:hypothetical protein